jgi:hypothetical protein
MSSFVHVCCTRPISMKGARRQRRILALAGFVACDETWVQFDVAREGRSRPTRRSVLAHNAVGAVMAVDDFNSLTPEGQARLRDPFFPFFTEVIDGASLEAYFDSLNTTDARPSYPSQPRIRSAWSAMDGINRHQAKVGAAKTTFLYFQFVAKTHEN